MQENKNILQLFYWPTPNGWKITIMLEECQIPYKINYVNIGTGEQFETEFLNVSPNNKIPAIIDPQGPDNKTVKMFESCAILVYLAQKTNRFFPKQNQNEILQWLFWQAAGLGPMAGQAHHFRLYANENIPYAIDRYTNECNRLYGVMDKRLKDRPYLAGDSFSIADIACVGWAVKWEQQGQDIKQFPNLQKWLERILTRPKVKKALAVGENDVQKLDIKNNPEAQKILFNQKATN